MVDPQPFQNVTEKCSKFNKCCNVAGNKQTCPTIPHEDMTHLSLSDPVSGQFDDSKVSPADCALNLVETNPGEGVGRRWGSYAKRKIKDKDVNFFYFFKIKK